MTNSNKLFRWRSPYDLKGTEGLFAAAMAENARFQAQHCPDYARILREQGVTDLSDPLSLPPLPTLYFKRHALFSLPERKMLIRATSSGTSGSMSRMAFDAGSLLRGLAMVWRMTRHHHLLTPVPCHYLILGYQPRRGNDTAFSKTGYGFTFFAPALSRTYALVWREGGYQLDLEGLRRRLLHCARSPFPIRTIGFPAYTWMLLSQMEKEGIRLKMPKGSKITMGGGWKQFEGQQVEKAELYRLAESVLGISERTAWNFSAQWNTQSSIRPANITISLCRYTAGSSSGTRTPWSRCQTARRGW